jgi:hypothetical protein
MTVMSNRIANHVADVSLARRRPVPGLARVLVLVFILMDVFAEAQDMERAAHRRYPFAEW